MSRRIYYSKDGTRLYAGDHDQRVAQLSSGSVAIMDSEPYTRSYTDLDGVLSNTHFLIWQFGQPVTIDRLMWIYSGSDTTPFTIQLCTDDSTTDGVDGNWIDVGTITPVAYQPITANITPISTKWLRVRENWWLSHLGGRNYAWHLFGSYDAPRYTLWESDESLEIVADTWLDFPDAPNHIDYSETKSFKIRNDLGIARSYQITAMAQDYSGSATIDSHFFISEDDGVTKVKTINFTNISAGGFSPTIYAHMDMLKNENPGVAAHYPRISIEELNT